MGFIDFIYKKERENLSKYAFLTENTKGRDFLLESDNIRTEFQRDRDRIIHSKSFRRLMHKTQVFLDPEGDHYRTRLTHTLEVTQIGRTLSRALRLNEDLTEAACLGHDLGHTPFGHAGEAVLNRLYGTGFKHNEQSLRVVEKLEKNFRGLNLTFEVRDAILCHTGDKTASTLEGRIVKFADRIAYINHDIEDAIRAKILKNEDLPQNLIEILGKTGSERINTMVNGIITASNEQNDIKMQGYILEAADKLREFLFEKVYGNNVAKVEEKKSEYLLEQMYNYFIKNYRLLLPEYEPIINTEGIDRAVCDYIAGMTDRFAINTYCSIFVPNTWKEIE
ncbi:MAG: deoxyguanosinetriphosphate triphosphohydrolase [Oscillospiraceae bacterium]|nr:deoxyguanosinetriphosphate triphosphohydrolase [Oscillospiraceae bacterium]